MELFTSASRGRAIDRAKPHVGFVIEQALGHVTYGMGLQGVLASRDDMVTKWMPIPWELGHFRWLPVAGHNWTVRGSLRARQAVRHEMRARRLDALFVHTQTISLALSSCMRQVPTVLSLDATPRNFDEFAHAYGERATGRLERMKLSAHKAAMKHVACFVAWSAWVRESLVNDYGIDSRRIETIHPGTGLAHFPEPPDRGGAPGVPLRVLFVGGDFVRKGGDLLLRACRALAGQVELHVVTRGGEQVDAGPGVFVHRDLKPLTPELLQRFREADVFVLPTRADCFANVLCEAMAAGLPIITTRVGAHAEAIEPGVNGFVVDVDREDQLRECLRTLVLDRELCRRMGRASRRIGSARFNLATNAHRIGDLLVKLAGERSTAQPA